MEVTAYVYEWLLNLSLIPGGKQTPEGNYTLDPATTKDFENGLRLGPVIKHLYESLYQAPPTSSNLDSLKRVTGLAAKAYNWKVISEELEKLGVSIPQEAKAAVISGNTSVVSDILRAVVDSANEAIQSRLGNAKSRLTSITEEEKDLRQSESCQEFFIVSLCQSFSIKPNQVLGLLADNQKFLGRIVAKGLKGDLEPVVSWVQQVYSTIDTLANLLALDADGFELTFKVLQLGLASRSIDVVQWTCRILSRLGIECAYSGLSSQAWLWFTSPQGGFDLTMMATQRNQGEVFPYAVELLLNYAQNNLVELFTLHLRNFLQDTKDYLAFISEMLPYLNDMQSNTEEIFLAGVVGYWAEIAMREAELDSRRGSSGKMLALALIIDLWKEFYCGKEGDILVNPVLNLLSRAAREEQLCVKVCALALMFECLEYLAKHRNPHSGSFYKALTFVFLGNYSVPALREMTFLNLKDIMLKFPAMPTYILVEPLTKQLQREEALSIAEFEFLGVISAHPSLTADQAVVLADTVAKVLMVDTVHAKAAKAVLKQLTERMINEPVMTQFLDKLLTFSLKSICSDEILRAKVHRSSLGNLGELQAKQQTKKQVLDFVLWLLDLSSAEVNQCIKANLIEGVADYRRQTGRDFTAFCVVLDWFGDYRAIMEEQALVLYEDQEQVEVAGATLSQAAANFRSTLRDTRLQDDIRFRQTRNDFPWERAFGDVQKARQKHLDIVKKRTDEEERLRLLHDYKKKHIKRQLELRKLEQGVSRTNIGTIIGFGEAPPAITTQEVIQLREFMKEEADEEEQVKLVLSKYGRVLKVNFQMYSGTGFIRKTEKMSDFDWLAERKTKLSEAEFLKMLKDYGVVPSLLTKEQLGTIIRTFALKQRQAEVSLVDFEGFRAVFCQLAYFIFSKEPRDYSHMPPAIAVRMLIDAMRSHLRASKKSTELYDEPDPGAGDREVVKQLNMRIAVSPEMELPEGYIRVTERDFEVYYGVPRQLPCDERKVMVVEILDDIFYEALNFHILEPLVRFVSYERTKGLKPKKPKIELPPIHERSSNEFKQKIKEFTMHSSSTPNLRIGRNVKLGAVLKYEVAKVKPDEKPPLTEVAELLEDILHSLTIGHKTVAGRWKRKADNPIVRQREEEAKREQEEYEKEKVRQAEKAKALREQLQTIREQREIKKQAEQALTEPQRALIEAKRKAKEELLEKKRLERHAEMAELRQQRQAKRQQELDEQNAKTSTVTAEVKRKHAAKLKANLKAVKDKFDKQMEERAKHERRRQEVFGASRKK
jgi:hypothetical protein